MAKLPAQILTPQDKHYVVVEKQTAFIHCKVFGAPTPQILWSKEDMEAVLQDPRYFVNTSGTLRITDVQVTDGGVFTCNASNLIGADSVTATLTVRNASQIVEPPRDQHIQRLHPVTFSCLVEADLSLLPMYLQWKKDGVDINEADDDESTYHIQDGQLKIKSVGYKDEGVYTCIATTKLDSVTASAQLIVVDQPDPPFDLVLKIVREREVQLSWSPGNNHNSPIEEFVVEFEENIFDAGTWHVMRRLDGDQQEAHLALSPYVNYSFRVYSVNGFGRSVPSENTERYMAPSAAPEKNPGRVKGEGSLPSNMIITWEVLKGLDWNGPDLQYSVKWRQQGGESEWKELVVESPPYVVNGTPTFVPFQIQVQAFNQEGSGPEARTVIGYSGENYPLENPESVGVANVSNSTVRVSWSPVRVESLRGHLRGYNVTYWKQPDGQHHHLTVHGNHSHAVLHGLEPYTQYSLEVKVFNNKGQGLGTQPAHHFTTAEGVPSQPVMLHLELLKDTEVAASWGQPHRPNGILTGYVLQYQQINGTESGPLREQNVSMPGPTRLTLRELQPHYVYKFHVSGVTSAGRGHAVTKEIFTSREGEPRVLKNISCVMSETNSNISWIGLEGYRVTELHIQYMKKDGAGNWKDSSPLNSSLSYFVLEGLEPGTPYIIKLWQLGRFKNITVWDKEVQTNGPALTELNSRIATEGWFIGVISAIVLLVLILLIACFIKRNKGGKYSVKDKEDAHVDSEARPMKDETFGEYRSLESDNDQEEKPFEGSQPSLDDHIKPLGSDDSLVEYTDSVDVQYNEDGSFIGQYSGSKEEKEAAGAANGSSGGASPVNIDVALE
uniref:neural cell adhesion molecule L1-like n=1 Tax=Pristiophorus japonicus TaxID=55135 RepID=UPI00398E335A